MYKYYFSALRCDRFCSKLLTNCDLGATDVGVLTTIAITTEENLTEDRIKRLEEILDSTKEEKSLDLYYTNAKFIKCERSI